MLSNNQAVIPGEEKFGVSYTSLNVTSVYNLNYPNVTGCLFNDTLKVSLCFTTEG